MRVSSQFLIPVCNIRATANALKSLVSGEFSKRLQSSSESAIRSLVLSCGAVMRLHGLDIIKWHLWLFWRVVESPNFCYFVFFISSSVEKVFLSSKSSENTFAIIAFAAW
jgi:hypothetical protein